jgi:anti-sigma B factor antagonist
VELMKKKTSHQITFELTTDDQLRTVLRPIGDLDLQTGPSLRRQIDRSSEPGKTLVIDLRQVGFMDSPGLGTLISCDRRQRERGGRLVLTNAVGPVWDLFELVRLGDVIEIE